MSKTAAFQTIGPSATTPRRIRELGGVFPTTGNDPTNIYATTGLQSAYVEATKTSQLTAEDDRQTDGADDFREKNIP